MCQSTQFLVIPGRTRTFRGRQNLFPGCFSAFFASSTIHNNFSSGRRLQHSICRRLPFPPLVCLTQKMHNARGLVRLSLNSLLLGRKPKRWKLTPILQQSRWCRVKMSRLRRKQRRSANFMHIVIHETYTCIVPFIRSLSSLSLSLSLHYPVQCTGVLIHLILVSLSCRLPFTNIFEFC